MGNLGGGLRMGVASKIQVQDAGGVWVHTALINSSRP